MRPWTTPPPLQTEAVTTSVRPVPAAVFAHPQVKWVTEGAEGGRVVGMLLASHYLVHGGPVLVMRKGLCSQGPGRGGSGF